MTTATTAAPAEERAPGPAPASLADIALALADGDAARVLPPTAEQLRIITAAPRPSLIVAGAGSGKTQTMMQRILYLIAHEGVAPSSVLGLTFTRKAAGELRERVDGALRKLRAAGLVSFDAFEAPEVLTYNAFANRVFAENALLVGQEPDATLLDDMAAFTLMREIVLASDDDVLARLELTTATATEHALRVARTMSENRLAADRIAGFVREFGAVAALPPHAEDAKKKPYADIPRWIEIVDALPAFVALAERYASVKRERGLIEFADQVSAAAEICERAPGVADELRSRHAHVILDEYQDTSVGQTSLLATLFRDRSVMAVGDPKQSIYGWRGASPGNMRRFHDDFSSAPVQSSREATFQLSTSWRNDETILSAANVVARRLPEAAPAPDEPGGPPADDLSPRELAPRPGAGAGSVEGVFALTLDEEADAVARWMREHLDVRGDALSAAILFRARRSMPVFADALARAGVPHRVLGLGGLLTSPEVTDLVCALRIVHSSSSGNELIRLLAGGRFRLGVADIAALSGLAHSLAKLDWKLERLSDSAARAQRSSVVDDDVVPLLDALAHAGAARDDSSVARRFSAEGFVRLREAAALVDELRALASLPLVELVDAAARVLRLDLETEANPRNPVGARNLDAFADAAHAFGRGAPGATLGAFLDWVDRAAGADALAEAQEAPQPGTVQLLTIHGAKGLEWDSVAVVGATEGELPSTPNEGLGWLRTAHVPYELLLDGRDRPDLGWREADSQHDLVKVRATSFKEALKERAYDEERRLAYVACTRARHSLLVSGSYWHAGAKRPRTPSRFADELVDAGILPRVELEPGDEAPAGGAGSVEQWPRAAFPEEAGARVRELADRVTAALAEEAGPRGPARGEGPTAEADAGAVADGAAPTDRVAVPPARWSRDIDLLLAERAERAREIPRELPDRLAASGFHDLVAHPEVVARDVRRPVPRRPMRSSRIGTMFHAWVEQTYGVPGGGADMLDATSYGFDLDLEERYDAIDDVSGADRERLSELQEAFRATSWAGRRPIEVERPIEFRLAGRTIVCKLDAVFERDGVYEVVDWKTGRRPETPSARWERQLQLALYTLAYAKARDVPVDRIRAVLVYVATGEEFRYDADEVTSEQELVALIEEAERRLGR